VIEQYRTGMLFLLCLSLYKGVGTRSKAREVEDGGASRKEVVSSRAEEEKKKFGNAV
jgi:hypothetical protein